MQQTFQRLRQASSPCILHAHTVARSCSFFGYAMSLFIKDLPPTGRDEKEEIINAIYFAIALVIFALVVCALAVV